MHGGRRKNWIFPPPLFFSCGKGWLVGRTGKLAPFKYFLPPFFPPPKSWKPPHNIDSPIFLTPPPLLFHLKQNIGVSPVRNPDGGKVRQSRLFSPSPTSPTLLSHSFFSARGIFYSMRFAKLSPIFGEKTESLIYTKRT